MSAPSRWRPRPDPAVTGPRRPGLRPHRHEPDHLYGWVFLQEWRDFIDAERDVLARIVGDSQFQGMAAPIPETGS